MLRLPLLEELDHVFRADASGGFEFTLFLAHDQFAVRIEDSQAGDSLFEGDFIFLCEVQVLVVIANADMNDVLVLVDERRD